MKVWIKVLFLIITNYWTCKLFEIKQVKNNLCFKEIPLEFQKLNNCRKRMVRGGGYGVVASKIS